MTQKQQNEAICGNLLLVIKVTRNLLPILITKMTEKAEKITS